MYLLTMVHTTCLPLSKVRDQVSAAVVFSVTQRAEHPICVCCR